MKLSKTKLSQLIREEFEKALKERGDELPPRIKKALDKHSSDQLDALVTKLAQRERDRELDDFSKKMLDYARTIGGVEDSPRGEPTRPGYDLQRLEELIKKALEEGFGSVDAAQLAKSDPRIPSTATKRVREEQDPADEATRERRRQKRLALQSAREKPSVLDRKAAKAAKDLADASPEAQKKARFRKERDKEAQEDAIEAHADEMEGDLGRGGQRTRDPSRRRTRREHKEESELDEAMPGVAGQFGEPGSPARQKWCSGADDARKVYRKVGDHYKTQCIGAKTEDAAEHALKQGRERLQRDYNWKQENTPAAYFESRRHTSLTKSQLADLIREELESLSMRKIKRNRHGNNT